MESNSSKKGMHYDVNIYSILQAVNLFEWVFLGYIPF